ncbi:GDSL esterase/lipase [Morus notabilis]|uniref:GDSL esterase/lipase n=1 Tax=Morus notabilis TaxID=981085 RepID=W9QE22_9ROSA|nr:GDSL esterase/lipase [Morus notabilis]
MKPQIVLFGDSITEQSFRPGGWGAALADTYSRKADVLVRGYGGYNTRWALFLLHQLFPLDSPKPPAAVTIFFGANDAAVLGRTSERQHVPIEEYKENLRKIVLYLKKCSPTVLVVLITPPPVDEEGRNEYARSLYGEDARKLPERTNEVTGVYAKQCVELAKEMGLRSIDLWSKMQEREGWQKTFLSQASEDLKFSYRSRMLTHGTFPSHAKALMARKQAFKMLQALQACKVDKAASSVSKKRRKGGESRQAEAPAAVIGSLQINALPQVKNLRYPSPCRRLSGFSPHQAIEEPEVLVPIQMLTRAYHGPPRSSYVLV